MVPLEAHGDLFAVTFGILSGNVILNPILGGAGGRGGALLGMRICRILMHIMSCPATPAGYGKYLKSSHLF